ncbi:hypothetical protein GCM10022243_47950 [Saccharothrix violaceirubra]|uniref:Streptogrisin C n=1 Tax=Saccharothrix violaceirubra TaxID=413306 RepID=A0A7W7SZM1_9PSEU|nr:S1 family peptidase [Saccharothrix violaceirubra]MBB4963863.1 streptogrisin C [Saccharothrix violaceirubra]
MRTLLALLLSLTTAAPPIAAGATLTTSTGARCTNGFNVRGHLILSPRCGPVGTTLHAGGVLVGTIKAVRTTYAVADLAPGQTQSPTVVGSTGTVAGATETAIGGQVCYFSQRGGKRCGTVQRKNATVNYPEGTITGLTKASLCPLPGDEWAPVLGGTQAQGHLLGGSGCTAYFLPLRPVLSAEGFTLVTG